MHLSALASCPKSVQDAVLQLIKFHANFTRTKTTDDFAVELAQSFIKMTPKPIMPPRTSPRAEAAPTDSSGLTINALR